MILFSVYIQSETSAFGHLRTRRSWAGHRGDHNSQTGPFQYGGNFNLGLDRIVSLDNACVGLERIHYMYAIQGTNQWEGGSFHPKFSHVYQKNSTV
jgi:hypothetical protein